MILDPYGDILAECRSFSDEFVMATLNEEKLKLAGRLPLYEGPET
ncbi:MAG: hypothetical protein WDM78_10520 [Puia sp.]